MKLSKLERVDLRAVWRHEEHDFTRWLALPENISILSEALGTELTVLQTEALVGRFSLDILAQEEGTDRIAVIENQLEQTDHLHLGQILTYAAGFDATMVVWVVKDVREEHREAIEWLNDRTDERTGFFLVRVELWRIGDSDPAPKFEIIVRPNEWAKAVKKGSDGGEISQTKMQQLEFWTRFKDFAGAVQPNLRLRTPAPQHWYDLSIGTSAAHISLTMHTVDNRLGAEIYIPDDKPLFRGLQTRAQEIEEKLGSEVEWIEAAKATRIKISTEVEDVLSEAAQEEYFRWLLDRALLLRRVFPSLMQQVPRIEATDDPL